MPECILPQAWTSGNCVPRQLAALLNVPVSEIEWEIEQQNSGWCETDGVSSVMLATFCKFRKLSLYLFHAENLVIKTIHPDSRGCVICAIWEDHAYIYQRTSKIHDFVRNKWPKEVRPLPKWRLKSDAPEKEELCTIPWCGIDRMEARAYHAHDLEEVRFQFLRSHRNPKVTLGGARDIRKLTYAFSSKDKCKGICTIHCTSKHADTIREFYERLGTNLKYEGEGIPPATNKALRRHQQFVRRRCVYLEHCGQCFWLLHICLIFCRRES
jgi:hypothetical protein